MGVADACVRDLGALALSLVLDASAGRGHVGISGWICLVRRPVGRWADRSASTPPRPLAFFADGTAQRNYMHVGHGRARRFLMARQRGALALCALPGAAEACSSGAYPEVRTGVGVARGIAHGARPPPPRAIHLLSPSRTRAHSRKYILAGY